MQDQDRQFFLTLIGDMWCTTHPERCPWGLWITEHEPLPQAADSLVSDVQNAWFLSECGLQAKTPWDYIRFWKVQVERSWCSAIWGPPNPIFGLGRHEIGRAGFAPYDGIDEFYFEWILGGLFGQGVIYARTADGELEFTRELWIA